MRNLLALTVLLVFPMSAHATLVIGTFDTPNGGHATASDVNGVQTSDSTMSGLSGILGGQRDIFALRTTPGTSGSVLASANATGSKGLYLHNQSASALGITNILYDGATASSSFVGGGALGLPSVDLTQGGINSVIRFLDVATGGAGFKLSVTLFADAMTSTTVTKTLGVLAGANIDFGLHEFAFTTGVKAILVTVDGTDPALVSRNLTINGIQAQTPEPTSLGIWAISIMGLAIPLRRRRRAST